MIRLLSGFVYSYAEGVGKDREECGESRCTSKDGEVGSYKAAEGCEGGEGREGEREGGREEEEIRMYLSCFLQSFVTEYSKKLKALNKKGDEMEVNYKRLLVSHPKAPMGGVDKIPL